MTNHLNRRGFLKSGAGAAVGTTAALASSGAYAETAPATPETSTGMGGAETAQGAGTAIQRCPVMHGPSAYKATGSFANQHW